MLSDLPFSAAVVDLPGGTAWDAATLAAEAAARSTALAKAGIGARDRVAVVHGGTAAFFADLMAVWSLGAAASCLDPELTAGERARVIGFLEPSAILDADGARIVGHRVGKAGSVRLDDPGLILFTSGTTGEPKGVVLSFRALLARLALNIVAVGAAGFARTLVTLPTHFGHGLIGNALTALHAGGTIVLPQRGLPLASGLGAMIDAERITFMSSVPTLWRLALKMGKPPTGGTLTRVHVGSAPLSAELWQAIAKWTGAEVVNCYGITETANWIGGASSRDGFVNGMVGRPWGGKAAVRDADGNLTASGDGEIAILSPSLMSGYLKRDDLTDAAFQHGWYRTGDRGTIEADGGIRLTGRIKEEINRAGFKIQPAEIDHVVEQHPAVEESCAFGMPDPVSGEIVAVAVRRGNDADLDQEGLAHWLAERLRREAVPERFFFVDKIPRTARGKVSRAAVRSALTGEPA